MNVEMNSRTPRELNPRAPRFSIGGVCVGGCTMIVERVYSNRYLYTLTHLFGFLSYDNVGLPERKNGDLWLDYRHNVLSNLTYM